MNKMLFIVNPIAGGGKAKKLVSVIGQAMNKRNKEYELVLTQKPGDAINIVKNATNKGYEIFVAVGGDGTVNEVAQGILEGGRGKLGILASGTGNDMARSLNIDLNPLKAIDTILKGNRKYIDVGYVNNRMFLNIASIGLDAETVKNTETIKKRIKSNISYIIGVIVSLFKFKAKEVELEIDDLKIKKRIMLVAVGNGKYYGGGLQILPMAILDDGYFDICIIKNISKLKILFLFPVIFKGNHIKIKRYVETYKAKRVKVKSLEKIYLNIDGEVYNFENETIFMMEGNKIPIFVNH